MSSIKLSQAIQAVFGAVVSLGRGSTETMQRPSAETVGKYLSMDPESAQRALNKKCSGVWEIPVSFDGVETPDVEWALHLMAMMLSTRLDCASNVVRRSTSAAGLSKATVASRNGRVHFTVLTERPICAIAFSFPRNALHFTALVSAAEVFALLEDCAQYHAREDNEVIRPLTKFILRHAASLRECLKPEKWCLSPIDYSTMSAELEVLRNLPDVQQMVWNFRGAFQYALLTGLVNKDKQFDASPQAQRAYASQWPALTHTWMAMCACEPLAFLHALINLHAPMYDDREAPNKDVLQFPDVPAMPSTASSFDYAVELKAGGQLAAPVTKTGLASKGLNW
jgi:hypothetical protein